MGRSIELRLDAMAHGGEALGRYEDRMVFVPYALPGERVRVEVIQERDRWARASLQAVLEPSPDRTEPPCPFFGPGRCAGCQWQHLRYPRQAELKAEIVADQLRRLARIATPRVADTLVIADPDAGGDPEDASLLQFGYRNRVQLVAAPGGGLGYSPPGGQPVYPISRCMLLQPSLQELLESLDLDWPEMTGITLRSGVRTGQSLIVMETAGDQQPELELDVAAACALHTPGGIVPLIGEPWITEEVAGRSFRISAESFFHENTAAADLLVELVKGYLEPRPEDVLVDAYCGVGLFALSCAESAAAVIGIESSPSACEDFERNADGLNGVDLHEGPADEVLLSLVEQGQRADLVVLDPPRAGAGESAIRALASLAPRRMAYVSCDPASLARDGAHLQTAGYELVEVQPIDLFPQTFRVETVSLWERTRP